MTARASSASLLLMIAGLAVWGLAFNVLYGTQALGCARGWNQVPLAFVSLHRALLLALWATLLALHGAVLWWTHRWHVDMPGEPGLGRFVERVSISVAWVGLAATVVTGSLIAVLSLCDR